MEQLDALSSQISFATDGNQYLTFTLGQEEYGVEILKVQEIKGYSAITPIPNTPPYIKGVMNPRGTIISVVDLRAKFGLAATEYNQFTVIIAMRVGAKVMGVIVDAVSDVLNIPTTPQLSTNSGPFIPLSPLCPLVPAGQGRDDAPRGCVLASGASGVHRLWGMA